MGKQAHRPWEGGAVAGRAQGRGGAGAQRGLAWGGARSSKQSLSVHLTAGCLVLLWEREWTVVGAGGAG